jgi:precorrin-2 dehydrogenase/sirohydrochlorin ferrochelatase
MSYYPLNFNLKDRKCVVIGGGGVAERKVEALLDAGASVAVVSPELTPRLSELAEGGLIGHVAGVYVSQALEGAFLAIAATDDRETNSAVSSDARRLGIPVNVVDDPGLSTFIAPATVRRGDLFISISTSGKSPALARRLREELESQFGPEYGELADILGELRDEVKAKYPDQAERNKAFLRILDSDVLLLLREGRRDEAVERARKCI